MGKLSQKLILEWIMSKDIVKDLTILNLMMEQWLKWFMERWLSRECCLGKDNSILSKKVIRGIFSFCLWQKESSLFWDSLWSKKKAHASERKWCKWFGFWENIPIETWISWKVPSIEAKNLPFKGVYYQGNLWILRHLEWIF